MLTGAGIENRVELMGENAIPPDGFAMTAIPPPDGDTIAGSGSGGEAQGRYDHIDRFLNLIAIVAFTHHPDHRLRAG